MPPANRRPLEPSAIVAVVLGVSSLLGLGAFAGIPALVLGSQARREIEHSNGARGGAGLAALGVVTGIFGTGLSLVVGLWLLSGVVKPPAEGPSAGAGEVPSAAAEVPSSKRTVETVIVGAVAVIDLGDGPLGAQLDLVRSASAEQGRTVILQTTDRNCRSCGAVVAALADPRMQSELANVTLVRVDVRSFASELESMRIETQSVPWFVRLDAEGTPAAAITDDAWGDDIPGEMAPALGAFVRGERRAP